MKPDRPEHVGPGRDPPAGPRQRASPRPDPDADPDERLVQRVLGGDKAAFDELVRRHERQALAVAYRLLNRAADAQEVVQDALLRAYRALDTLENPQIFGPWLFRIVSNLALNYRRSRARRSMLSLDEDGSAPEGGQTGGDSLAQVLLADRQRPEDELMTAELQQRIQQVLEELPDRQRAALVMFSIEQIPQKDVAAALGCSVEAVKWHVFAARKKLKEKLADLIG